MDSEKYSAFRYSHLYMDVDLLQLESGTRKVIETCLTSFKLWKMEWNSQNSRQWVKYFCYSKQQYCGSASLQWECKFYFIFELSSHWSSISFVGLSWFCWVCCCSVLLLSSQLIWGVNCGNILLSVLMPD